MNFIQISFCQSHSRIKEIKKKIQYKNISIIFIFLFNTEMACFSILNLEFAIMLPKTSETIVIFYEIWKPLKRGQYFTQSWAWCFLSTYFYVLSQQNVKESLILVKAVEIRKVYNHQVFGKWKNRRKFCLCYEYLLKVYRVNLR